MTYVLIYFAVAALAGWAGYMAGYDRGRRDEFFEHHPKH